MFENGIYSIVSYDEMVEAKEEAEFTAKKFKTVYKNFLMTCLCNAGFANKWVRYKLTKQQGLLLIEEKSYWRPYEIKFFPLKKNGDVSLRPVYIGIFHDDKIVEELIEKFELVGDENAG